MQFDWKRLFLSADGRIGRQEFWIGFAILFAAGIVLGWIPILGFLVSLVLCYAQVCLGSKRLHDMGRSGFLMLLPFGAVLVFVVLTMIFGGMAALTSFGHNGAVNAAAAAGVGIVILLLGLVLFVINVGFLLWVGLTPGQPGENRYGPEPVMTPAVVPPAPPAV